LSLHAVRATGAQHLGRRNSANDIFTLFDCTTDQVVGRGDRGRRRRSGRASIGGREMALRVESQLGTNDRFWREADAQELQRDAP